MKPITVIMAGGSGTRFWPASRSSKAKQSLSLFGSETMLANTIKRAKLVSDEVIVVSSLAQKESIDKDCEGITVLYEPVGRNTAPCLMLATRFVIENFGENSSLFILPADQHIANNSAFTKSVSEGFEWLESNSQEIGTIGINPTRPETGYGYIKNTISLRDAIHRVEQFVEKPDSQTAQRYLDNGSYLWNGGMFLFKAKTMQEQFEKLQPEIFSAIQAINSLKNIEEDEYKKAPSISFDYAIMETTEKAIFTVATECGWSDVGSWFSYWELLLKDENGNASQGAATFVDSHGCMVYNACDKPLIVFNKSNELVVSLPDAILTASLSDHQRIKEVVQMLGKLNLKQLR
ncbi:mannose-1-phosphate guanylyltransferase [bacterium]|nr:mannose-1-phosphate guanylyltransferase [bacterium]